MSQCSPSREGVVTNKNPKADDWNDSRDGMPPEDGYYFIEWQREGLNCAWYANHADGQYFEPPPTAYWGEYGWTGIAGNDEDIIYWRPLFKPPVTDSGQVESVLNEVLARQEADTDAE